MNRTFKFVLFLAAAAAIAAGAYRLGAGSWPTPSVLADKLGHRMVPSADTGPDSAVPTQNATPRKVLYWRDPDGKPAYSATSVKTTDGRDYVPVHEDEEPPLPGEKPSRSTQEASPKTATGGKKILYYRNPMGLPDTSPVPKKDSMNMDYIPVYEGEDDDSGIKVSSGKIQRTGVRSDEVERKVLTRIVRAPGVIALDERRISVIALRFDAYLEKVADVTTGTHVKQGEPLMTIYAPDLLATGARLVVEQETGWWPVDPSKRTAGSETQLRAPVIGARRQLENMDVPKEVIDDIARTRHVPDTVVWPAPRDGIVLERSAVEGMRAQAGEVLFRIADHSHVWAIAEVPEAELGPLKQGQAVTVRARAHPGREFHGKVAVIYPHLNKGTRTATVRVEIPNPDLALLPDMYTDVEIVTGSDHEVVAVPESAVIDSGTRQVVILDQGDGRFEPREVKLGQRGDGFSEVLEGLKVGDKVVTAANFLLDAESNLRAALKGFTADAPPPDAPQSSLPPSPQAGSASEARDSSTREFKE
jgi:Cu(I)/Ag(I) efflux system membrane fusion protein